MAIIRDSRGAQIWLLDDHQLPPLARSDEEPPYDTAPLEGIIAEAANRFGWTPDARFLLQAMARESWREPTSRATLVRAVRRPAVSVLSAFRRQKLPSPRKLWEGFRVWGVLTLAHRWDDYGYYLRGKFICQGPNRRWHNDQLSSRIGFRSTSSYRRWMSTVVRRQSRKRRETWIDDTHPDGFIGEVLFEYIQFDLPGWKALKVWPDLRMTSGVWVLTQNSWRKAVG